MVLGRNLNCDVIFPCSSVSNHHAKLHNYDCNFYLTDFRSSNGTHHYLREPLEFKDGEEGIVRIERSTVKVCAQKPSLFSRGIKHLPVPPSLPNPNYNPVPAEERRALRRLTGFEIMEKTRVFDNTVLQVLVRGLVPVNSVYHNMVVDRLKSIEGEDKVEEETKACGVVKVDVGARSTNIELDSSRVEEQSSNHERGGEVRDDTLDRGVREGDNYLPTNNENEAAA